MSQFDFLSSQKALEESFNNPVNDLSKRFNCFLDMYDSLQKRIKYLEKIIKISNKTDLLASKVRNLSAISSRRFMNEEDDSSLHTAVNEQKSIIDQMRQFEVEVEELKKEATNCGEEAEQVQLPAFVEEKLYCVDETVKQSLSEEIERRDSLLEIKNCSDQKQVKIDALSQNLEIINNILSNKHPNMPLTPSRMRKNAARSNESYYNSINEKIDVLHHEIKEINEDHTVEFEQKRISIKKKEFEKYLYNFSKCKDIIESSRRILGDLKQPFTNMSVMNLSTNSGFHSARSPTPCASMMQQDYHELREMEHKLDAFEHDIDMQINRFEHNLARQAKIDKSLDDLNKKFLHLIQRFNDFSTSIKSHAQLERIDIRQSISLLENDYDKAKAELNNIQLLRKELKEILDEKNDLLREDNRNLNQSRVGSLHEAFNETIFELDMKKDNEINCELKKFETELEDVEEKCKVKLNEIKYEIEQQNISKKQRKLNKLRDTLDLQLDTLVSLKLYRDDDEDLLKESENILLDKVALDDTSFMVNKSHDKSFIDKRHISPNRSQNMTSRSRSRGREIAEEEERLSQIRIYQKSQ